MNCSTCVRTAATGLVSPPTIFDLETAVPCPLLLAWPVARRARRRDGIPASTHLSWEQNNHRVVLPGCCNARSIAVAYGEPRYRPGVRLADQDQAVRRRAMARTTEMWFRRSEVFGCCSPRSVRAAFFIRF
jgi:hypothetical protein